ncbi:DUF3325 domain-containing protein [Corticibacter populi]|uniref:DUF3325 domain-containing protein n=1 Tax=Corticibacter populi TaxID=1550736 RepID=A0A3M6QZ11_9BURK|nr:DUF3325 domain-containing protein [Corticibacter populi]RMX08250.1 DUF3325 domain-containing protein [Corticibacter populi]RZS35523.1 uncharacterized protein DUF3325 [Corticibacter populi]
MNAANFAGWEHLLVFVNCLAGFACLALAMDRHQSDLFGRELAPKTTRLLRMAGWLWLLAALWLAVARMGWSFGLTAYSGHTSAAAALVFIALLIWCRRQELIQQRAKAQAQAQKAAKAAAAKANATDSSGAATPDAAHS